MARGDLTVAAICDVIGGTGVHRGVPDRLGRALRAEGATGPSGFQRVEALVEPTVQLGELRRFVTDAVALLELGPFDDVAVLTHELVKNALALEERNVRISVQRRAPDSVRVEVRDNGYGLPAVDPTPGLDGGFGLRLVEGLADRWGVDQFLPGKIVWFELDPRPTPGPAAPDPASDAGAR